MDPIFTPDNKITLIAEAYSLDAIVLASKTFDSELDWTDGSVAKVETILSNLHSSMPIPPPPDEVLWNFAKGFGSYIGEVFRKNHGGEWGLIRDGSTSYPGMRCQVKDTLFWPWGKVHMRLVHGDEHNVWVYYKWIIGEVG